MVSNKSYLSFLNEPDISLSSLPSSQSELLLDNEIQNYKDFRSAKYTLSNKNRSVKLRDVNYNSLKYKFRPYRCSFLFIFPLLFTIIISFFLNDIETLTCVDCSTEYFICDDDNDIYQYACGLNSIKACCYNKNNNNELFCETFKYNSIQLNYNKILMKNLKYSINVCVNFSYALLAVSLIIVSLIYILFDKYLNIPVFHMHSTIQNYDKIFLTCWVLTSIILLLPLYFYLSDNYIKCSNWNIKYNDNLMPFDHNNTNNNWTMGPILWMCVASFCQIFFIGFCGCTFINGIQYQVKNYEDYYDDNDISATYDIRRLKN